MWQSGGSGLRPAARRHLLAGDDISKKGADWPKHPGALAGRLRRVQTPLRMLGIEICFSRRKRDVPDPRAVVLGRLQIHYR
jgi:hypothetical protein